MFLSFEIITFKSHAKLKHFFFMKNVLLDTQVLHGKIDLPVHIFENGTFDLNLFFFFFQLKRIILMKILKQQNSN